MEFPTRINISKEIEQRNRFENRNRNEISSLDGDNRKQIELIIIIIKKANAMFIRSFVFLELLDWGKIVNNFS